MDQITLQQDDLKRDTLRLKLPENPGVYLFKDLTGNILYIGKAKNLKKRLLSYFRPKSELPHKTSLMMNRAKGLDYFLTATEKEAFILESSLVKRYMPRYNIVLRDDKAYPCLRLDIQNPYPRLTIVRRIKKDGALYFGPFSSANSVRSTLKLIDRLFHLRKCKGQGLPKRTRPCLNYQLERCLGACVHEVSLESYGEIVNQVRLFLEGRNRELITQLKENMALASEQLNFEKAAQIRDQIQSVERTIERQHVVSTKLEDMDIIGLAHQDGVFQLVILFIRKGYLSGNRNYLIKNKGGSPAEVVEAFLKQYYPRESFIPRHILVSEPVEDLTSIADWLSDLAGRRVTIHRPMRGEKRRFIGMAIANAKNTLASRSGPESENLMELAETLLKLRRTPNSIEGLDISNIHGNLAVGAIVSFSNAQPNKAGYRNYRIKSVKGIDDYGMMTELISRRLSQDNPPDLFLVDGGKGHLQVVKKAMEKHPKGQFIDIVSIAKSDDAGKADKIYLPGRKNPLPLKSNHPLLHLLMRIRDEAHRRAISYHRRLRGKGLKGSRLDEIPGIGSNRKMQLLQYFGDIDHIANASVEDLMAAPGIGHSQARRIVEFFEKI